MRMIAAVCSLCLLLVSAGTVRADSHAPIMRISLENVDGHIQTRAARMFADAVMERIPDDIDIEVFTNAELFRDRDVLTALERGQVDMAIPGTWHISRYVPEVGATLLPIFYGLSAEESRNILSGEAGRAIDRRVESELDVHVLGGWIDLGQTHLFFTDTGVTSPKDIRGKRIRVAGGEGNSMRIEALGATSMTIAWPDLPDVLSRGSIDGLLTSYMTVATADLHEHGIRAVYEDGEYFARYIPVVRTSFWNRLPESTRTVITEEWNRTVAWAVAEAARMQDDARRTLINAGVVIHTPSAHTLAETRSKLMKKQKDIAAAIGVPSRFVDILMQE